MRSMELKAGGKTVYQSNFDEKTGSIVRVVEVPKDRWGSRYDFPWTKEEEERYRGRHWRNEAFSPVPETVDVSITDKCGFGCSYCYQDSKPGRKHAPKDLVEKIIAGFDIPPYQMAIGGGEPTTHPDFPWILQRVRELGTVPNYTTNGAKLKPEVVEATNEFCGGVAMTYHAFKGIDWFVSHYENLREALKVQVNVHLIFDKDIIQNLRDLVSRVRDVSLVLLAYYPDVGRGNWQGVPSKKAYNEEFPTVLQEARDVGYSIAFSEGLMPYFLSRPELGVDTRFAMRSEGRFSCYFDPKGRISTTSFRPPWKGERSVYKVSSQVLWNTMSTWGNEPNGATCYGCKQEQKCSIPHDYHYLMCKFARHNKLQVINNA